MWVEFLILTIQASRFDLILWTRDGSVDVPPDRRVFRDLSDAYETLAA